eukprot:TRINITY_DN9176_c0_g2_i1.p1 TRINITY_DN9176_c0_g2~~TRINITY_DN9176_c0_g2_i1.p1  ORF type:complete len:112 (+),score=10.30 TRINITY_DN9176_c0_g2_i1:147-482(+)
MLGKPYIPHRSSNELDKPSYTCLGLSPVSLRFWVGIWYLTWYLEPIPVSLVFQMAGPPNLLGLHVRGHVGKVPHRPSNGFDRPSYMCLGLLPISLSFWVGIWYLTWYQSEF